MSKRKHAPWIALEQLAKLRKYLNTDEKMREVAAAMRCSAGYLAQLKGGHRKASDEFAKRLAAASAGELRPGDVRPDLRGF